MIMTGQSGKKSPENNSLSLCQSIILIDSTCDIDELTRIKIEYINPTIITFDYESHQILEKNQIPHQVSDIYLNEDELETIQKNSYPLSNWFNESIARNSLEYDGINLGELFYVEFHYFLVPFLKKFLELKKISLKYNNANFIATPNLFDIISTFGKSVKKINADAIQPSNFLYDTVKYHLKIGNKFITFNVTRSFYLKLKHIFEKGVNIFFGPKKKSSSKSVLLVELDTVKYRSIFSALSRNSLKPMAFCRRRPVIWNLSSLFVILQSKCQVATFHSLSDIQLKKSIDIGISKIKSNLISLWEREDFFKSYFKINGISFWESIKHNFILLTEKRVLEGIQEVELVKKLLHQYHFSSILIWTENGPTEQIIVKLAKQQNIPLIILQHGYFHDGHGISEVDYFIGGYPIYSDKFIVWGKNFQQYLIQSGILPQKIEILGAPFYDELFTNKITKSDFKNGYVILATSVLIKSQVSNLIIKTREKYEQTLKTICKIVLKSNKKLIIKLHPGQESLDLTKLAKEIDPTIMVVKGQGIIPLIKNCDIFLTIDISTTILEAQILKKPVVSIRFNNAPIWEDCSVFSSNSCIRIDLKDFENVFNRLLNDEEFRNTVLENGTKFIDEFITNQGFASEKLTSFLRTM